MAPITQQSLDSVKVCFATPSLGMRPMHTLESKLEAMSKAGYKYVELGFGNYMAWVRSKDPKLPPSTCPVEYIRDDEPDPSDEQLWDALYSHAEPLKALAKSHGLTLLIFQPLSQFEGWPKGSHRAEWVRRKAERWLLLCSKLGVGYLQVGTNDEPDATSEFDKLVEDMTWVAELGAKQNPPVRISYEPWCFSPHTPDWESCWKLVQASDHHNLGLCIDTAHIAVAPAYGYHPRTGEGYTEALFQAELDRIRAIPGDKIHFYEISDMIKPQKDKPLLKGSDYDAFHHSMGDKARDLFTWSMCGRCIPLVGKDAGQDVHGESDMGDARCVEVTRAVFNTGFRGPCSYEVFEQQYMDKDDPTVPTRYATAGMESKQKLWAAVVD